ncbi:8320_t:CDS:2 [Cetraspora pellucida]|uniref:8320_t:CDS:1 n=1 Tax=Cetraspora pellucida TaxID=1433469 RepID=A0A9N8YXY4_9GLOM|nr:8320_t:CDS:2 [Cetraspora pellucida]
MSRSLKKPLYVNEKIQTKVEKANQLGKKIVFKVWDRASTITPEMIDHTLLIHNGKKFLSRKVTQAVKRASMARPAANTKNALAKINPPVSLAPIEE